MSDEILQSFFEASAARWLEFKRDDPSYFSDVTAFIAALAPCGITVARPSLADTRLFTHIGIRRIIEDFISLHPAHPLPLERITLVRHIPADAARADLAALTAELATAREAMLRFANAYNIAVDLTLYLAGFDATAALELC